MVATNRYDGLNRRIVKAVTNSGDLNCTYHYYYDKDWRVIEQRNASNFVLKQMVWAPTPSSNGSGYTDELVQVAVNQDLFGQSADSICEEQLWILQDANYNVMGLVDSDGDLVERYEYTPYGERKVFASAGVNDSGCYSPTLISRRVVDTYTSLEQPFGLCELGHQGLMYEEHLGNHLMDVRNRVYNVALARWNQTDPEEYVDGANPYSYVVNNPTVYHDNSGRSAQGGQQLSRLTSQILSMPAG